MSILQRALLAFGIIILIGALQVGSTLFGITSLTANLADATAVPIARVDAAWRAADAFREADAFLDKAVDSVQDQTSADAIARFKLLSDPIDIEVDRALGGETPDADTVRLVATIRSWKAAALVLLGDGGATSIPSPHIMERRGIAIRSGLRALVVATQTKAARARTEIEHAAARTQLLSIVFAVAVFVFGAGIAIPFALSLVRPLRVLQSRMRRMVEGDLDSPVTGADRRDEIGGIATALAFMRDRLIERRYLEEEAALTGAEQTALVEQLGRALNTAANGDLTYRLTGPWPGRYATIQTDFNTAIESIQRAIATVASTTGLLFGGSEEIARATTDVARRSETQATRLQDAAAALNAVSEAIRATASNTRLASEAVSEANAQADRSGTMMRDAIEAISRIEASSGRITQITDIIDEMAARTNILALNATIEAARAGAQGKGFAVVAAEVRALAHRSTAAVEEIKSTVGRTQADVVHGADLVQRAGEVIDLIMQRVANIDALVGNVAMAAERQASGLKDVVGSVSEADEATQHNVKLIDSSAASIQRFHDQAAILAGLVGHFKIGPASAVRAS